ncbi:hypothetical protein LCGC14_0694340 [marine sediment metagenome]|uniref:Uncharacterized protein n=1 Tax=marine sediment metagenome TaxID=412755 RepID=A0A0F9R4Y1_9ZZZZ
MKLEVVMKVLMGGKEFKGKGSLILFGNRNRIYYRDWDLDQRREDAIKLNQRPDILADGWWKENWELFEEEKKQTLSDKWIRANEDEVCGDMNKFYLRDVKQFIKDIKEDIKKLGVESSIEQEFNRELFEVIDKRAGKRLI